MDSWLIKAKAPAAKAPAAKKPEPVPPPEPATASDKENRVNQAPPAQTAGVKRKSEPAQAPAAKPAAKEPVAKAKESAAKPAAKEPAVKPCPQQLEAAAADRKRLGQLLERSGFAGTVTPRLMAAVGKLAGEAPVGCGELVGCLLDLVQSASAALDGQQSKLKAQAKVESFDLSQAKLLTAAPIANLSLATPRGRFEVSFSESVACFRGKSGDLVVHYDNIAHMFQLPLAPTEKKTLIVLALKASVPYLKQTVHQVIISVPDADQCTVDKPVAPLPESLSGSLREVLCSCFKALCGSSPSAPSLKTYHNSKGGLSLKCYKGAQDGLLFFYRVGMCFSKPYTFLEAAEIDKYEITSVGRSFEINFLLKSGKKLDFSMIDEGEYEGVAKYFRKMTSKGLISSSAAAGSDDDEEEEEPEEAAEPEEAKPSDQPAAQEAAAEKAGNGGAEESESDDDYDPEGPSDDEDEGAEDDDSEETEDEDQEAEPKKKKPKLKTK